MAYYISKIAISALLITVVSELARKNSLAGALLASVPILSLLAVFWLYHDTGDSVRAAAFLSNIFWLTLPSLAFFLLTPFIIKCGGNFYLSIAVGLVLTVLCYFAMVRLLTHFNING